MPPATPPAMAPTGVVEPPPEALALVMPALPLPPMMVAFTAYEDVDCHYRWKHSGQSGLPISSFTSSSRRLTVRTRVEPLAVTVT